MRHQQGSDREEGAADADLRGAAEGDAGLAPLRLALAALAGIAVAVGLCAALYVTAPRLAALQLARAQAAPVTGGGSLVLGDVPVAPNARDGTALDSAVVPLDAKTGRWPRLFLRMAREEPTHAERQTYVYGSPSGVDALTDWYAARLPASGWLVRNVSRAPKDGGEASITAGRTAEMVRVEIAPVSTQLGRIAKVSAASSVFVRKYVERP